MRPDPFQASSFGPEDPLAPNPWQTPPGWIPPGPHNVPTQSIARARQNVVDVREINRFPLVVTVNFAIVGGQIAVNQSQTSRIYLSIRNSETSTNILYIGFGFLPAPNSANFSLPVGGQILLDYVVPQNDIWLFSAGANAVIGYADA